ncbi:MAG: hypothetical protein AAF641_15170 [Pseudomonadota bacterium]
MSKTIKSILALSVVGFIAACGQQQQQEEFVIVDPEPISIEPVHTGKFK